MKVDRKAFKRGVDEVLKARAIRRALMREIWENIGRQFEERYPDSCRKQRQTSLSPDQEQ